MSRYITKERIERLQDAQADVFGSWRYKIVPSTAQLHRWDLVRIDETGRETVILAKQQKQFVYTVAELVTQEIGRMV